MTARFRLAALLASLGLWGCLTDRNSGGSGSETENTLYGDLVDAGGKPVEGARVQAVRTDKDPVAQALAKRLAKAGVRAAQADTDSVQVAYSDDHGRYVLRGVAAGRYNLIADYRYDSLAAFIPAVDYAGGKAKYVGLDTMHAPGKIMGAVDFDAADKEWVLCGIPGTSYLAITDKQGKFTLSGVPQGSYTLSYRQQGYATAYDSVVVVKSGQITRLPVRGLIPDTSLPPPAVRGFAGAYDPNSNIVSLHWNALHVGNLASYEITRSDSAFASSGGSGQKVFYTSDTTCQDTLNNNPAVVDYFYRIRAVDRAGNVSATYAQPVHIRFPAPGIFSWRIDGAVNGRAWAGDSLQFRISLDAATQALAKVDWYVGVDTLCIAEHAVAGTPFADSISYAWSVPGKKRVLVRAWDLQGKVYADSVQIEILSDPAKCNCWTVMNNNMQDAGAFTLRSRYGFNSPNDIMQYPSVLLEDEFIRVKVATSGPSRVRLLWPIQAASEDAPLYAAPLSPTQIIDSYRQPQWRGFPYRYEGDSIIPDSSLRNHLEPGGWVPMPWVEVPAGSGGIKIDLSQYVDAFNVLPDSERLWRTFGFPGLPSPKGTFTFNYDPFPTAQIDMGAGSEMRKVSRDWPPTKPFYGPLPNSADTSEGISPMRQDGNFELPFYSTPSRWGNLRRTRSLVVEFAMPDAIHGGFRTMYSLQSHDLSIPVAAPSVDVASDFTNSLSTDPRHLTPGAMDMEGILLDARNPESFNPVSRNLSYWMYVISPYPTEKYACMAYYLRIPDTDTDQVQPITAAVRRGDFMAADNLKYVLLKNLSGQVPVRSDGVTVTAIPGSLGSFNVDVNTQHWASGTYILWFAAADRDFVSGPLLASKPGPAMPSGMDMPFFDPKPGQYAWPLTPLPGYRKLCNPRIFRFVAQDNGVH